MGNGRGGGWKWTEGAEEGDGEGAEGRVCMGGKWNVNALCATPAFASLAKKEGNGDGDGEG